MRSMPPTSPSECLRGDEGADNSDVWGMLGMSFMVAPFLADRS